MPTHYCGACSNHVDGKTAVRWVKPDGKTVFFCSEECKVVGENIEPPESWAPTPPAAVRDFKREKKATMKRKSGAAAKRAKKAKKATKKAAAKKGAKRPAAKKPVAKKPAKKAKKSRR